MTTSRPSRLSGSGLAAAVAGLYPGVIRRAIFLRPLIPLEVLPEVDLSSLRVQTDTGREDPYGAFAPRLVDWLRHNGAALAAQELNAGHALAQEDLGVATSWLKTERGGETR